MRLASTSVWTLFYAITTTPTHYIFIYKCAIKRGVFVVVFFYCFPVYPHPYSMSVIIKIVWVHVWTQAQWIMKETERGKQFQIIIIITIKLQPWQEFNLKINLFCTTHLFCSLLANFFLFTYIFFALAFFFFILTAPRARIQSAFIWVLYAGSSSLSALHIYELFFFLFSSTHFFSLYFFTAWYFGTHLLTLSPDIFQK